MKYEYVRFHVRRLGRPTTISVKPATVRQLMTGTSSLYALKLKLSQVANRLDVPRWGFSKALIEKTAKELGVAVEV